MVRIIGVGLLLAVASTAAVAFQEQKSGAGVAGQPSAVEQPKELGFGSETVAKQPQGTEVRIPGLGKLGVLPKMDFGLELLYGAAEQGKAPDAPQGSPSTDDDLTIRGTVKHRW